MKSERPKFNYGGQAVIEGVMMRGAHVAAIAVRNPQGEIVIHEEPLNATLYRGWVSRLPFVRGLIGLWDALGLGTKALMWSANIAADEETESKTKPDLKTTLLSAFKLMGTGSLMNMNLPAKNTKAEDIFSGGVALGVIAASLSMGIGLFFVVPAAASSGVGRVLDIESRLAIDTIEGVIKLSIFLGYLALIGMMEDVKRLFGYHGAEHKTINAYEAGADLTPDNVQYYPIEHPRCGTAFLLNVIMISILVHALTGRPDNFFALVGTRILAIPIIAGIAYEILRFNAKHIEHPIIKAITIPNLALQHMTTRQPDKDMLAVAIEAFKRVLAAEESAREAEAQP